MGRLEGYRTVVTGAGAGIGKAIVERYLAEGARVVGVARKDAQLEELEAMGALPLKGDVTTYETAEQAVAAAVDAWGGLDTYVANAGLWDFYKRVEKQSPEELEKAFQEIFGVNLLGTLYGARAALAPLHESKGSVIATGSNACFLAGGGGALYTSSKFALRGLVMQLAKEFAPHVRVNGVAPGATDTGISGPAALGQDTRDMNADKDRMATMEEYMMLGRVSQAEDHASLYVLLASREESSYVTGAMFKSDGGLTISV